MSSSPEQIASAISGHRFEEAIDQIAPDVNWDVVGESPLHGRDAVVDACRQLAAHLTDVTTEFRRFRTIVAGDSVVVDSLADYTDAAGDTTTVRSCDIYDFTGDRLTAIASYNVEIRRGVSRDA